MVSITAGGGGYHVVGQGDVEEVRRCLLNGLNGVDQVDELGCTAVHLAGAMVR